MDPNIRVENEERWNKRRKRRAIKWFVSQVEKLCRGSLRPKIGNLSWPVRGAFKYRFLIRGMDMIRDIRLIGLINGPSCQSPSTLHYSFPLNPVNVLVSPPLLLFFLPATEAEKKTSQTRTTKTKEYYGLLCASVTRSFCATVQLLYGL